jgi:hypothetical protein
MIESPISIVKKQKPSVHYGTEGQQAFRGTTQIHHPERSRWTMHFALTNISLPCNAGIAVRTTEWSGMASRPPGSHERLERELQLISVECNFQLAYCTSLAASASLLSSVTAFIGLL